MRENYDACFEHVLGSEGGFQDDYEDRGNYVSCTVGDGACTGTNWGISSCSYPDLAPIMRELTQEDAKAVYLVDYWNRVLGDQLPYGVDLCTFDGGINSGVSKGAKWLQAAVGVPQDGIVGPQTMAAVYEHEPHEIVDDMCDARMAYLKGLSTWDTYGNGWTNRVDSVRAEAHKMIDENPPAVAPVQSVAVFSVTVRGSGPFSIEIEPVSGDLAVATVAPT